MEEIIKVINEVFERVREEKIALLEKLTAELEELENQ